MQFVLPFTKSRSQSGNLPNINNEKEMIEKNYSSADDNEEDSGPTDSRKQTPTDLTQSDFSHIVFINTVFFEKILKKKGNLQRMKWRMLSLLTFRKEKNDNLKIRI
ncbi:hypothetical protein QE152_g40400 [Popillia japonica]|uniref:Uncharacterized protein n=1 Tax=Popillia japonica TaxID=7064 RepID=A0AAW1HRH6_POPJA